MVVNQVANTHTDEIETNAYHRKQNLFLSDQDWFRGESEQDVLWYFYGLEDWVEADDQINQKGEDLKDWDQHGIGGDAWSFGILSSMQT